MNNFREMMRTLEGCFILVVSVFLIGSSGDYVVNFPKAPFYFVWFVYVFGKVIYFITSLIIKK